MTKLVVTYILIIIATTFGFISNAYVMDKAKDMYCCNDIIPNKEYIQVLTPVSGEEEEVRFSNIYFGLDEDHLPVMP